MSRAIGCLAAAAVGYGMGNLPSADLAARAAGGADLRRQGTQNPGAMNASHVLGKRWGLAVSALDIGKGPFDVIRTLQGISAIVQTVPRLDGSPSDALRRYRERKNRTGLHVLGGAKDTEGSITVMSLVARHNVTSKNAAHSEPPRND